MAWYDDYLDAWTSHDSARIVSFMAPNVTYTDVALGQTHTGRTDIAQWIDSMVDHFSTDYSFESGPAVATDTGYALEWVMKGTHDRADTDNQLPATGKPFAIRGVSVGELADGKITRNTDYWSLTEFLMQVELMPSPQTAKAGAPG
ncbi:MAG TPA: nuclear transport factor 2 family protein [Candidatus Dormibacteraeota bacterium]